MATHPNYLSNYRSIEFKEMAQNLTELAKPTLVEVIGLIDPARLSLPSYFGELKEKRIETRNGFTFLYSQGSLFIQEIQTLKQCLRRITNFDNLDV